ncbi:MAG: T9SS type A sorting domain-containing protein [Bacteroidota bacterium]
MILEKITYKYFLVLFFIISFISGAINELNAQSVSEHIKYSPAKRYSSNVISSFFPNLETSKTVETTQPVNKKSSSNKKVETDNINNRDSLSLRESNDGERVLVCLKLQEYNKRISISIYNMLAKRVLDIYEGTARKDECPDEYTIHKSKLPNGVYLCVVTGEKLKLVDKFIVSK